MFRALPVRATAASAITLLALSLTLPAATLAGSVAPTTRWVDDNAGAGGGPAACATASYTTIQGAIDESNNGDRVYVCPGTYVEQLTIDKNVKVRARPLHSATIIAPADGVNGPGALAVVYISGESARLRGFNIDIPAGSAGVQTIEPVCEHYDVAVWALGEDEVVRNNYIRATGPNTLGGDCGYDYGVVVGLAGTPGANPSFVAPVSARVTFNHITDFKYGGVLVEGSESSAFVRRNTLSYLHESECVIAAIVCNINLAAPSVNNAFEFSFGVGVESGAEADVLRNSIRSGSNACTQLGNCQAGQTQALNWGVALTGLDGSETTNVAYNVVRRAVGGIVTNSNADGAVLEHNFVHQSHYGFQIGGDNDEFSNNHSSGNEYGASVNGSGNNIHDNDFRNNSNTDCQDLSSGTATQNTANTWTNDLGNTDSPDGICIPDA